MSDMSMVPGFEDVCRPPVRPHRVKPETLLGSARRSDSDPRARLSRLSRRAPEVMVKVTGRTRDAGTLRAHLDYISRNGKLELEDRDGGLLTGRGDVKDVADAWSETARLDRLTRANSPLSLSLMLSMPAGSDPTKVRDAARAFASTVFAGEHDYVFALHTDTPHPHVHMAISARGDMGQRPNPKKADLELWRQVFAQALRDRGIDAEATPRRARGVTRKAERTHLRKIRERHEAGLGPMSRVKRSAYSEAAKAAFQGDTERRIWERKLVERQTAVRTLYLQQARLLARSNDPSDRAFAEKVEAFVRTMPQPDSERLALARELRDANRNLARAPPERTR